MATSQFQHVVIVLPPSGQNTIREHLPESSVSEENQHEDLFESEELATEYDSDMDTISRSRFMNGSDTSRLHLVKKFFPEVSRLL